jgi:TonB family protein
MTLSIKEAPELDSMAKPSSSSNNPDGKSGRTLRSNPVCLELPVTIRSLHGTNREASGSIAPTREESRTVIVFDNGAVLRLSQALPHGQAVILSDAQGRDVVCRVVSTRNLPNIKGYIEIEFVEPVDDFWRIHQTSERTAASTPAALVPAPPQALPVEPVAEPHPVVPAVKSIAPLPAASPVPCAEPVQVVAPEKETNTLSGGAPTFDDIAGLVSMSSAATSQVKPQVQNLGSAPQTAALNSKEEAVQDLVEAAKGISSANVRAAISEVPPSPAARESSSVPVRKSDPPLHLLNSGRLSSGLRSSVSSQRGTPGRTPMIVGGAAVLIVVLGAGFFFMYRGSASLSHPAENVAVQLPTPVLSAASEVATPAQTEQSVENQTQVLTEPVSMVPSVFKGSLGASVPSDSALLGHPRKSADANQQSVGTASKSRPVPDLKMSSPVAPTQDLARLGGGSAPSIAEVTSSVPVNGALSPVVRTENQPAPPTGTLPGSAIKIMRDPKLLSSTRPMYPSPAKLANVQGTVVVSAEVDEKGNVIDAKAISGPSLLRPAAINAVLQWKYQPEIINGKSVAAQVTINIDFRLNN